jgi:excisionase family DNA binding protein
MLTLSDAANAAGVAKSTIWRAIKAGRISASKTGIGSYQVDAAELFRVFPPAQKNDATKQAATGIEHLGGAAQEAQIAALKDISNLLRDQLEDLRKDRDAWRGQAEANQRILIDARKRWGIFGLGRKAS